VHANRGAPPCPGTPLDKSEDYRQLATILRHLARWGYVVISSDASGSAPGIFGRQEILEASVRYLVAENGRTGSPFKDRLRTSGVSLMGHSTGGGAALALADGVTLDVAAVATLVPGGHTPNATIPTMVVGVSEDDPMFGGNATAIYDAAPPPKHFVSITGANHFGFTEELCFESDGTATISRDDQQRIALAYLTASWSAM
jgi:predicted dienelactone hydrolase